MRKKNQKGFLIALCLCMLSLSGIYGVYQYQKSAAPTPEEQSAQLEQDQKETANSRGAAGQTEAKIETEEDVERLQAKGIKSTQATISRDIKELHLIKEPAGQGKYRYAVSAHRTKLNFADKLRTIFRESVLTVDNAQNIVVIKTLPGLANAAGSAVDGMDVPYLVGSLAGDDTALLIMRDTESAVDFTEEIKEMLR